MSKFNRYTKERKAMFTTMSKQLIQYEQIETTITKAKDLRKIVEKLITKAKDGNKKQDQRLAKIQLIKSRLGNDYNMTLKLMNEIAPRFLTRNGGYTRIIPTGFRKGDKAKSAIISILKEK